MTATITKNTKTIVIALSGGVDSSVAAALVLKQLRNPEEGEDVALDLQQHRNKHHNYNNATRVVSIHMSNWNQMSYDDDSIDVCTSQKDWDDAVAVAKHLNIKEIYRCSFESEYWNYVFEPYLSNISSMDWMGNPDIDCNRYIKFGTLQQSLQKKYGSSIDGTGNYTLVTGHYARIVHLHDGQDTWNGIRSSSSSTVESLIQNSLLTNIDNGTTTENCDGDDIDYSWVWKSWGRSQFPDRPPPLLLSAVDKHKDQSYFLSGCSGDSFRNVIFPLGEYYKNLPTLDGTNTNSHGTVGFNNNTNDRRKPSVREIATELMLPTAAKRDSMGICFIGKRRMGFSNFVEAYFPPPTIPVTFLDVETGRILGSTPGPAHAALYTTGQGAKVSGLSIKHYVVAKCIKTNTVLLCPGTHHPALYSDSLIVRTMNWIARNECPTPFLNNYYRNNPTNDHRSMRAQCRVRHLQPLVHCSIWIDHSGNLHAQFDNPLRAVTAGQMATFYIANGLISLGGGPIESCGPSYWDRKKELPSNRLHPSGHNDLSTAIYTE